MATYGFTKEEVVPNGWGDGFISILTCTVCDATWPESHVGTGQTNCTNTFTITEWDGELYLVHVDKLDDRVRMQYMDGRVHEVSWKAYAKLKPWWKKN